MSRAVDLSALNRALATLELGLAHIADKPEDILSRDGCIKRFEYCYELSHKVLRRHLEATEPEAVKQLSFPNLIRLGFERGLLAQSWDIWFTFRDARNITSHAYNEPAAIEVLRIVPIFLEAARYLSQRLKEQAVDPA